MKNTMLKRLLSFVMVLAMVMSLVAMPVSATTDDSQSDVVVTSEDTTSGDTTSEDTTSEDTTSEDTTSEDTTSEDTTSEDTTSEDTTSEGTTSEDTTSVNTTSEDTTSEDTTSEDTTSGDTTSEDTTSEDTTSDDTTSEDTTSEDTTSEDTISEDTPSCTHEGGSASCQELAVCDLCRESYGELAAHNYGTDADGKCDVCGTECAHSYTDGACTVCGAAAPVQESVCTCGTDDPAIHATNCPLYVAPENPECYCAEKCTAETLNLWCDICGVQGVEACEGTDTPVAYYTVKITQNNSTIGTVKASTTTANEGDKVTLTVTTNQGVMLYSITVTDENGNSVEVTDNTFIMPAGNVAVHAIFKWIAATVTPVGGTPINYATLEEAIEAAAAIEVPEGSDGPTVKLLKDASSPSIFYTVSGTVTLDLNGYVINYYGSNTNNYAITVNAGANLTIVDSRGTGTIKGGYLTFLIRNYGTMTVTSGAITADTNRCSVLNYAELTVNGGTLKGYVHNSGIMTVNGGTLNRLANYSGSSLTINGGTITSTSSDKSLVALTGATVNIYGGTFSGNGSDFTFYNGGGTNTVTLYGGTFLDGINGGNSHLNGLLADGYAYYIGNTMQTPSDTAKILSGGDVTVKKKPCTVHELTYTDNRDGSHTVDCENCDTYNEYKEEHAYLYALPTSSNTVFTETCTKCKHSAEATVNVPESPTTYDGTHKAVTVTFDDDWTGEENVTIEYTGTNGTQYAPSSTAPINAGSYSAKITINSVSYNGVNNSGVPFYITKANEDAENGELTVTNKLAKTYTLDLTKLLPALTDGKSYGTVSYEIAEPDLGAYYTGGAEIKDGVLSLPIQNVDSNEVGDLGGITIHITTDNYTLTDATITVKRNNKATLDITGVTAAKDLIYNGNPQPGYTGTPTAEGYEGDFVVEYSGTQADGTTYGPSAEAPKNAGTYSVKFSIPNTDPQFAGETTLNFTIARKEVRVKADDITVPVGSDMPTLTCTVTGLLGEDTQTIQPNLTCNAANMNMAGKYTIEVDCSVTGSNYDIQKENGTLTVVNVYNVKVADTKNGTVTVSADKAVAGTQIVITAAPKNSWYSMKSLVVTDAAGESVAVALTDDGKYAFAMPESDVTVTVTFGAKYIVIADETNPKTGDPIMLASAVMLVSATALAVLLLGKKKRVF